MTSFALLQFGLSLLAGVLGLVAGWWLRGRPLARAAKSATTAKASPAKRQQFAADVLQSLHAAAETVRTCVEQHTECMRKIQSELSASTSTEPAVITSAAEMIIASSGLVQHQLGDIRNTLADKRQELKDCISNTDGLLVTFASLDRQKHMYRQVLASLEMLAAELAGEVKGHGQKLEKITGELTQDSQKSAACVATAVSQILDATNDIQQRVAKTEDRITTQAETMHMQAILTHTDLLTSLPNRRAFEAEMLRAADQSTGRGPMCTMMLVDIDGFSNVNNDYGHQGGDVILRQAAAKIKPLMRGRDMVARYGGDSFAILMNQTTLHDALPIAERVRKTLETADFSHGTRPLRLTASVGVAQLIGEEMRGPVVSRVEEALAAAQAAGGNLCFRHDGQGCVAVSSAFQARQQQAEEEAVSLASLWRDTSSPEQSAAQTATEKRPAQETDPTLTGRSLFASNLGRRLAEWKRGGSGVSVALMRVDQLDELIERFGEQAHTFLRQVLGRLLEATTREMDERCEFEDGLFALILPCTDNSNALAVAERLRSQVRQCKVRIGRDLWDLTASIGVAHCTVAARVMDIMLSAEAAMNDVAKHGGDAVGVGQPIQEPISSPVS
jgi:diguanylate cyclase (GGDEF)-like protein